MQNCLKATGPECSSDAPNNYCKRDSKHTHKSKTWNSPEVCRYWFIVPHTQPGPGEEPYSENETINN